MPYNFDNVPADDAMRVPPPGTIAVFTILDLEEENIENGIPVSGNKVWINITFGNDEYQFRERFYMLDWKEAERTHARHASAKRLQHLFKHMCDTELEGDVSFERIKTGLINKQVALPIVANIRDTDDGIKCFSQIRYMNFAKKPVELGEIAFTEKEVEENARGLRIQEQQRQERADTEDSQPASSTVSSDPPVTEDDKF